MGKPFQYRIVVEWSQVDEAFIARAPAFPSLAADGDTPAKAAAEIQVVIGMALESLSEHGEPIPEPDISADFSGQLRLRLPKELHARLARQAAVDGVSLNTTLVQLISESISRHQAPVASKPRRASRKDVVEAPGKRQARR